MEDRYLFKAKRADNGEWVQGYLFDDGFENGRVFIGGLVIEKYTGTACDDWTISGSCFCKVDKSTICQCTGLRDKNGKLIWENDFLKYELGGVRIDSVKISSPIFSQTMRLNLQNYEIIGNIFDNPELLESEE
jgi:uncharacterized phage protein (TIGR01671 family)